MINFTRNRHGSVIPYSSVLSMHIVVHTDGGARGNPGPAAIGVVIEEVATDGDPSKDSGRAIRTKEIARFGKRIGEATNNVAEYRAVIEGLNYLKSQISNLNDQTTPNQIHFFIDSNLVVQQLNGRFKVKDPKLRELLTRVRILEQEVGGVVHYHLVPRERNHRADFLVNKALNNTEVF